MDSIPENPTQCTFNFDVLNSQPIEHPVCKPTEAQGIPQKRCKKCTGVFPKTDIYFYKSARIKDGFESSCKKCRGVSKFGIEPPEQREGEKYCTKCEEYFPATDIYFYKSTNTKDGFESSCKKCRFGSSTFGVEPPEQKEGEKYCTKCEKYFPATEKFFSLTGKKKDKLESRCKTCVQARKKAYENRPSVKARRKAYHRAWRKVYYIRPEIQARQQAYGHTYRARPDIQKRERARRKVYRSDPRIQEKEQADRKIYYSRPEVKERYRLHSIHRRVEKKSVEGTYTPEQIQELLIRQKHKCYYCFNKFGRRGKQYIYHIEHTFPISRVVGSDIPANDINYIVLSCPTCNLKKHDRFPWEFPEGGRLL